MRTTGFLRAFWALTKPFWVSEKRVKALALLVTVVGLALAMVYMEVQFNYWNRDFYNTFENRDQGEFFRQLGKFGLLAVIWIRSEERRVGKEWRVRGEPRREKRQYAQD